MKRICSTLRRPTHPVREIAALIALAALSACGGSDAPPPAAPVITSAPQALTVGEGTPATFTVAATSTGGELFYEWTLTGTGTIAGADEASYTIAPTSLLDDGKQFSARLTNDIGVTESAAVTLSVNERAWATAAAPDPTMQATSTRSETQAVAVDSLGHTHLLYGHLQENLSVTLRWALKPKDQAAPAGSQPLAGDTLSAFMAMTSPQLVAGPQGSMLAVWREGVADDGGNVIKGALFNPATQAWLALGTVSTETAIDAGMPAAARVGPNQFELVWREHDGITWNIRARRLDISPATPSWAPIEAVESTGTATGYPLIASDGQGNTIITFNTLGTPWRAWANTRSAAETTWNAAGAQDFSSLTDANATARVSHLTMNSHGRAVALFHSDETRVYVRQYQFGGTPSGWLADAEYVANRWEGLDAAVQPVALLDDSSQTRFTIVSIHNNGAFVSRWPCTGLVCGAPQTFLNAGAGGVNDFAAGHDAAGNLIVVTALGPDFGGATSMLAIRHHAALDSWRSPGHGGNAPAAGKLHLAVHPDGSATTLQTRLSGETLLVRSADFR